MTTMGYERVEAESGDIATIAPVNGWVMLDWTDSEGQGTTVKLTPSAAEKIGKVLLRAADEAADQRPKGNKRRTQ